MKTSTKNIRTNERTTKQLFNDLFHLQCELERNDICRLHDREVQRVVLAIDQLLEAILTREDE